MQAMLPFDKTDETPTPKKGKTSTPLKSESALPFIAKRLVRLLKGKPDPNLQKKLVVRCAEVLTETQINSLPDNARKLVVDKKAAIELRKKM